MVVIVAVVVGLLGLGLALNRPKMSGAKFVIQQVSAVSSENSAEFAGYIAWQEIPEGYEYVVWVYAQENYEQLIFKESLRPPKIHMEDSGGKSYGRVLIRPMQPYEYRGYEWGHGVIAVAIDGGNAGVTPGAQLVFKRSGAVLQKLKIDDAILAESLPEEVKVKVADIEPSFRYELSGRLRIKVQSYVRWADEGLSNMPGEVLISRGQVKFESFGSAHDSDFFALVAPGEHSYIAQIYVDSPSQSFAPVQINGQIAVCKANWSSIHLNASLASLPASMELQVPAQSLVGSFGTLTISSQSFASHSPNTPPGGFSSEIQFEIDFKQGFTDDWDTFLGGSDHYVMVAPVLGSRSNVQPQLLVFAEDPEKLIPFGIERLLADCVHDADGFDVKILSMELIASDALDVQVRPRLGS